MTNQPKKPTNQPKSKKVTQSRKKPQVNDRFQAKSNRASVDLVIQKLAELGRLEDVDVALLNLARAAATLVDDQPTPAAIKEYGAILTRITTIGKEADNDFALLVDQLRTEIRDA